MDREPRANSTKVDASTVASRLGQWHTGQGPLYRLLADGIEDLVRQGVLHHHDRLPAERALAEALSVSRGTVVSAYDLLRDHGRVERVQGSGTLVLANPNAGVGQSGEDLSDNLFAGPDSSINLLLATCSAVPLVLKIAESVRYDDYEALLDTAEPAGVLPLRRAVADHITRTGLPSEPEQIVITTGAQQAIGLIVSLLVSPGDVVLTESTTWPGLAQSVRGVGARVHGVPMDDHGVIPAELRAAIERLRPSLIGLNPHHHNPTGTCLSPQRRIEVAELAADYGVPLVEDRVTAHLSFDGSAPRPIASERPDAAQIVVDSVNKVAWPGVRIGWVRADAQMAHRLRARKALADLYSPLPSQFIAIDIIEQFDEIAEVRRQQLAEQHTVLADELTRLLPDWELPESRGGLAVWVGLPHGSATSFGHHAARFGVAVAGGREFSASSVDDTHLRIPFTLRPDVIREGVSRLAAAWADFGTGSQQLDPRQPATII